ncbi:hypothetical protein TNCV_2355261 [Trichonephila clavipes]|nr:hypothetical protein TNCV_2355261 [Trichonephila clavipes]
MEWGSTKTLSSSTDSTDVQVLGIPYTRVWGDEPRNFEPWSSDEDDTTSNRRNRRSRPSFEQKSFLTWSTDTPCCSIPSSTQKLCSTNHQLTQLKG